MRMLNRLEKFLAGREVEKDIYENIGYLVQGGSHIFGTNNKTSDTDLRGIVIPTEDYILGLKDFDHLKKAEGEGKINLEDDLDIELYSLRQFFKHALQGHAIQLEMLFLETEQVIEENDFFSELLENREMFVTKRMVRNYIAMNKQFVYGYKVSKERVRNPLSVERIEKYGYETKYASKALQHFYVLKELMETGKLKFYRKEKEYLLEVKEGKHPIEKVGAEIADLAKEVEELLEKSTLPEQANFEKANQIYKKMVKKSLEKAGE